MDSRQKIRKDTVELNTTTSQLDIMDTHRLCHPTTAKHTFFSSSHGTFTNVDHFQGHKKLLTVAVGVKGMVVVNVIIFSIGCGNKTFKQIILWNYILEHWKISRLRPERRTASPATTHMTSSSHTAVK